MAYIPSKTDETNNTTDNQNLVTEGSTSVDAGGNVTQNTSPTGTPGQPNYRGVRSNFQTYAKLLQPQGEKLAQDFVGRIAQKNQSSLQKELDTAQQQFNEDRLRNIREYNPDVVNQALQTAQTSEPLQQLRETGYSGPSGLTQAGIQAAIEKAQADREKLNTAAGRRSLLTTSEGITPGMAALDAFLMQRQTPVFQGANFAQQAQQRATQATTQAEQQAQTAAEQNRAVAQQTEQALTGGTQQYFNQLQQTKANEQAALSRINAGQGTAADYQLVGLQQNQVANLRDILNQSNLARTQAPIEYTPSTNPTLNAIYSQLGWNQPGQTQEAISRFSTQPYNAQGLVNDFILQRYGNNPNASKVIGHAPQLGTFEGIVNQLINPNISANQIDLSPVQLEEANKTLSDYLSGANISQAQVDRLNALENLAGVDVGNIDVSAGPNYQQALTQANAFQAARERAYQDLLQNQQQSIQRALNQAAADRAAGITPTGPQFRQFNG